MSFNVCRQHEQTLPAAICLEIHAGTTIAEQERHDVVAPPAVFSRDMDFDGVIETEQARGAIAIPDHHIER